MGEEKAAIPSWTRSPLKGKVACDVCDWRTGGKGSAPYSALISPLRMA